MNKKLHFGETFVYYDEPLVFSLYDDFGANYVGVAGPEEGAEGFIYAAFPLKQYDLGAFAAGKMDLLSIIRAGYPGYWYGFNKIDKNTLDTVVLESPDPPHSFMPEIGFVMEVGPLENTEIIEEATDRRRSILHFSLSDTLGRNVIAMDNLGVLVKNFQEAMSYIYKKLIRNEGLPQRLNVAANHTWFAFTSSEGSFKLHLQSAEEIGDNEEAQSVRALEVFNKLVELSSDPNTDHEIAELLQDYQGYSITYLTRLIQEMLKREVEVKFEWYTPGQDRVKGNHIDISKANRIYNILKDYDEVSEEEVILIGTCTAASQSNLTWSLLTDDLGEIKGTAADVERVVGLKIGNRYKFTCIETVTEEVVGNREKKKYLLTGVRLISDNAAAPPPIE